MLPSAMRGLGDLDFEARPGFRRLCEWPRLSESVSEPRPARILPARCQKDGAAEVRAPVSLPVASRSPGHSANTSCHNRVASA
jgi:hypothetical protein